LAQSLAAAQCVIARRHSITEIIQDNLSDITLLNTYYAAKAFEYRITGIARYPSQDTPCRWKVHSDDRTARGQGASGAVGGMQDSSRRRPTRVDPGSTLSSGSYSSFRENIHCNTRTIDDSVALSYRRWCVCGNRAFEHWRRS
jgi:hypothetical protein